MNGPIPESYWVEPARLAAGEYPGALRHEEAETKLAALRAAGVTSFVDLTEDGELEPYAPLTVGLRWIRLPIPDVSVPSADEMRAILDRIDAELARGETVYVHCWGGHGRTGTVVGCRLVRQGLTPEKALIRISELRRGTPDAWKPSPEVEAQREFVRSWLPLDPEALLVHAVQTVAPRLEQRGQDHVLGETKDLHAEMKVALRALVGERFRPDRKVVVPGWEQVGNVDLTVSSRPREERLMLAAEEKWDKLDEEVWDLFKMALVATRSEGTGAFLVCGVSTAKLQDGFCADLVDTGRHSTLELCERRYPTGKKRLVWDWMLEGGYDHAPAWVPGEIETRLVVRAPIESANAEVRVVRVSPVDGAEPIPFSDGWPYGERPRGATHPVRPA